MPIYIGDYLADTMHLTTEQHGAYLLLIFHLWRRGTLPNDDALLAKVTGLSAQAWRAQRSVLAEFFSVSEDGWAHAWVEQERARVEARSRTNTVRARKAATLRWDDAAIEDAPSIDGSMLGGSKSQSQSQSEPESQSQTIFSPADVSTKRSADERHVPFRGALAEYWAQQNHASPAMPWQGRDARALGEFLAACPHLDESQFRHLLANRARSAVAHGDRVYLWIGNLTRFQEEITRYNQPASAGGGYGSRAEINRDSVLQAVGRAITLSREGISRAGHPGAEPAGIAEQRMPAADGPGSAGCAVGVAGRGDSRVAAGHAADGAAGGDGPVPYGATATVTI